MFVPCTAGLPFADTKWRGKETLKHRMPRGGAQAGAHGLWRRGGSESGRPPAAAGQERRAPGGARRRDCGRAAAGPDERPWPQPKPWPGPERRAAQGRAPGAGAGRRGQAGGAQDQRVHAGAPRAARLHAGRGPAVQRAAHGCARGCAGRGRCARRAPGRAASAARPAARRLLLFLLLTGAHARAPPRPPCRGSSAAAVCLGSPVAPRCMLRIAHAADHFVTTPLFMFSAVAACKLCPPTAPLT